MPLFSIIIPTFNSSSTLPGAIQSVLSQDFNDYEIWIIDGKSTDRTIELIEAYQLQDTKVHFISEPDNGIYDAMNKGIEKADGDWLLFVGSDDELFDSRVLKNVSEEIVKSDTDFIYGDVMTKGNSSWAKDGTVYDGLFTAEKLLKRNICHQSVFYKRAVFRQTGNFNIQYTVCADWDMNHRFFARGKTRYIPHIISRFYAGGESTQNNHDLFTDRDCVINIKKYYGISFFNKLFQNYGSIFCNIANEALQHKAYSKSLYYFSFAVFHSESKYNLVKSFIINLAKSIRNYSGLEK